MSSDALMLLNQRLAALETVGVKTIANTANPGPLGLYGFAFTTALLQGCKTTLVEPNTSQMVFGYGIFFGGLAQFVAGILAYQRKNTFAMTAFCSYGAFWMSLSLWGTLVAAGVFTPVEKGDQMMLSLWGIITFLFWLCTFSMNLITSALFFTLSILFWLLAAGVGNASLTKAAGVWGFIVAFLAFYDGTAQLMQEVYGRDILPLFPFKPINKLQLGNFGTKRRVDTADLESAKA